MVKLERLYSKPELRRMSANALATRIVEICTLTMGMPHEVKQELVEEMWDIRNIQRERHLDMLYPTEQRGGL